jgi:hypothetical protein
VALKQKEAPQDGGGARPLQTRWSALITILIGAAILACAFLVVILRADLPYKGLFVYTGIATLLTAAGASAAVLLNWQEQGQKIAAGGAAAVAIALSVMIGPDRAPQTPIINVRYYINFPDGKNRELPDLVATATITDALHSKRENRPGLPVTRAPFSPAVMVTIADILASDYITLQIHSTSENKTWETAEFKVTESSMPVSEAPSR